MMQKRSWVVLFCFVLFAGVFSCNTGNNNPPQPNNTVQIKDNFFDPPSLTVAVGRQIVWRHVGNVTHTVTSGSPTVQPGVLFDSGPLNNGGGFAFTFSAPGSYQYFCRQHGVNMTGLITVQ
ncbi:MAG TPA: plastocyanin/azurin family copper-binding protein [Acidobacteriota bacterium]|nr:plastocyanin/azurin family copper-binding protein [Acidobacteriota bacterium]